MGLIDGKMTYGGLSGFGITWRMFLIWLGSFVVLYHIIGGVGGRYARRVQGYEVGNRYRLTSVLRLELIMVYLSIPIYLHLFSYFHKSPESQVLKKESEKLKKKCFSIFMGIMVGAHITYFFYLLPFDVPYVIYWPAALSLGLWMHLFFFACLFMGGNAVVAGLNKYEKGRTFVSTLCRIKFFKTLIVSRKVQVILTLTLTAILSVIQWYSSDKVVIKRMELKLKNFPVNKNPLNIVLLTDLHGGAMVYREQISDVVDKTNSIEENYKVNVDAVFIVGDAIDAPRAVIEKRMEPLKFLKSKLGTFFVSGNHEFYYGNYDDWKKLFIDYGIRVLENEIEHLEDTICLVGLHDISAYKSGIKNVSMDESSIAKCQKNESVVVLAHNPASTKRIMEFANYSGHHVDLILSGHTHSGQYYILVPYIYWLLPYLYGLYPIQSGTTQLFVSAGTLYQASPMKMVAEPRYKRKICVDPQNLKWKNDSDKFGQKMMEKMGWKEGKGLGVKEQGMTENLKMKANFTQKGLKADSEKNDADKTWMSHHDEFSFLLEKLNKKKVEDVDEKDSEESEDKDEPKNKKSKQGKSIEETIRSRNKFFYRRTRMKDLSRYSEKDKSAVIGIRKKREEPKSEEDDVREPTPEKESAQVRKSEISMNDYFAQKMAKFYAKKQEAKDEQKSSEFVDAHSVEETNPQPTETDPEPIEEDPLEAKKRRKMEKKARKLAEIQ